MSADPALLAANSRRIAARARLMATVAETKARLAPSALASNAVESVKTAALDGVDAARERPAVLAAVAGALGLLLARKPIAQLFRRRRRPGTLDPNATADDGES